MESYPSVAKKSPLTPVYVISGSQFIQMVKLMSGPNADGSEIYSVFVNRIVSLINVVFDYCYKGIWQVDHTDKPVKRRT